MQTSQICEVFGWSPHQAGKAKASAEIDGIGEVAIFNYVEKIGIKQSVVREQLANLKASKDYARILQEVQNRPPRARGREVSQIPDTCISNPASPRAWARAPLELCAPTLGAASPGTTVGTCIQVSARRHRETVMSVTDSGRGRVRTCRWMYKKRQAKSAS